MAIRVQMSKTEEVSNPAADYEILIQVDESVTGQGDSYTADVIFMADGRMLNVVPSSIVPAASSNSREGQIAIIWTELTIVEGAPPVELRVRVDCSGTRDPRVQAIGIRLDEPSETSLPQVLDLTC